MSIPDMSFLSVKSPRRWCFSPACIVSDRKNMHFFMFEKAERLIRDCNVQVLIEVKTCMNSFNILRQETRETPMRTFQQDRSYCHTSAVAQKILIDEFWNRFWNKDTWPSSSPDLNPVNFAIWSNVVRKICEKIHKIMQAIDANFI